MDKIHKFSPIIKQKFGLVFGGHYTSSIEAKTSAPIDKSEEKSK